MSRNVMKKTIFGVTLLCFICLVSLSVPVFASEEAVTITYVTDDESLSILDMANVSETYTIKECMFVEPNDFSIFKEWNTKRDGTGTAYNANQSYIISTNLTLYSIWQENTETGNFPSPLKLTSSPSKTTIERISANTIFNWYPQDRIFVTYSFGPDIKLLPWTEVYKDGMNGCRRGLVLIPSGMSLVDTVKYCDTYDTILDTIPSIDLFRNAPDNNHWYVKSNLIKVAYNRTSQFRLPWTQVSQYMTIFTYQIPSDMTLEDAFAYCNQIGDIIYVEPIFATEEEYIASQKGMPLFASANGDGDEEEPLISVAPSNSAYQTLSDDRILIDGKELLSWYPKDRLKVQYSHILDGVLPWEIIEEKNIEPIRSALVKIPEGMSLIEALSYCLDQNYVSGTVPNPDLLRSALTNDDKWEISSNKIAVCYLENSSFRLDWEIDTRTSDIAYKYVIPSNMTIKDAFNYCNSIDDIAYCEHLITRGGFASSESNRNNQTPLSPTTVPTTDSTNAAKTPVPLVGALLGGLVAISFVITKGKR